MPKPLTSPDRLFDRTWRPGHPFGRRLSGTRRWGMATAFALLCTVIGGYLFVTDSDRVRHMAESYLSDLLGGPVKVGDAKLSIFEGLRLDNVRLYAGGAPAPDWELFTADSFIVSYSPRALLSGRIDATRIIAVEPKVYLTEDVESGRWTHQRLARPAVVRNPRGGMRVSSLPEILLRNATVVYRQLEKGRVTSRGSIDIEGQLTPVGAGPRYTFQLQSRGHRQSMGPVVIGDMDLATRQVTASLKNFEFGDDVKAMLPSPVRRWWEQHQLAGSLDVNELTFIPPNTPNDESGFKAEIALQGVMLTVQPQEWMGEDEHRRMNIAHHALNVMRVCALNGGGFVDRLSALIEPMPIKLHDVFATFVFTDSGIEIRNLTGKLEDISFSIGGQIGGYSPAATWDLNVRSLETRNVEIPESPRYVTSMPQPVREVYDHFRPHGECSFWVRVVRPDPGARLRITGEINILDGSFTFDKFPYPVRKATGRIVLVNDEKTGYDGLEIQRIRGRGVAGGPNENSFVEINGTMGPFRSDIGVDVTVTGQNITSEPALIAAFPQQTRTALRFFDAPGKGEFPRFGGDFGCSIRRLPQHESHWVIKTDIDLQNAAGALVAFPYPMSGVTGKLEIFDDHVNVIAARMSKGDASIQIDGRVSWPKTDDSNPRAQATTQPSLKPEIRVVAKNVPIDRDLLAALPTDRRAWIERIGLGGKIDIDGTVKSAPRRDGNAAQPQELLSVAEASDAPSPDALPGMRSADLDIDLRIALHDGTMWPAAGGTFAVSNASGEMHLTPDHLTISKMTARRGDAQIDASGGVSWPTDPPQMVLHVEAKNLLLDSMLYQMLPEPAKRGWEQVRPDGTVDASLSYSGAIGSGRAPQSLANRAVSDVPQPTTRPGGFELTITPRKLAATPAVVPYRLEQLAGSLTVQSDRIVLKDITARHGDATVSLAATGSPDAGDPWDFQLAAKNVTVDDELRNALPTALADLFKSMQLAGKIDFEFSKLHVGASSNSPPENSTTRPTTQSNGPPPDMDFAVAVKTDGAAMDVGVPLTSVRGGAQISGSTRNGKVYELNGQIDVPAFSLAGRDVTDFRATLYKLKGQDALQLGRMEARLAGGSMAGEVNWAFPDNGPSRYALALVLRNADVSKLAGEGDQDIRGQASASLALEGAYSDATSRRGRGDVSVVGERMYRIPLVLGLLQITNLALPITSPFHEATARYSIDGNRVTFEQIELRAKEMLMQGTGHLDFGTKQVRMTFTTDSTAWPKLPLIGDLLQTARHELLQIHVRGTLQDPKVSATSMNTFTTTIDEVLRGDDRSATQPQKKPK
jgi:hypothetical protein